jgi:hypothetical protein
VSGDPKGKEGHQGSSHWWKYKGFGFSGKTKTEQFKSCCVVSVIFYYYFCLR